MEKQVPEIFESEYLLMHLIWDEGSVRMRDLTAIALAVHGWQRTTVYTMIKRLSERGVVDFTDSVVTPLFTKEQVQLAKAREFVDYYFDGKVSALLEAFADRKKIRKDDAARIREIMKHYAK